MRGIHPGRGNACPGVSGLSGEKTHAGAPVRVHRMPREATSLGAALTAGSGIGWYRDFAEAARSIRIQCVLMPDPEAHEAYSWHYKVCRMLYPSMREAYESIYRYRKNPGDGEAKTAGAADINSAVRKYGSPGLN